MSPRRPWALLAAASLLLVACGAEAPKATTEQSPPTATYPPVPTFPVPAELLAEPVPALPSDFGPANWALDPDAFPPDPTTTELRLLVWERACSGGAPATGRMSAPVVDFGPTAVTVTLGVRPLEVPPGYAVTCPGPPGTPAILRLAEPLGSRSLLDGGCTPPVVRAFVPAPFGPDCAGSASLPLGAVALETIADWDGFCAMGVGVDLTLHGSAADPRRAWGVDASTGHRSELVWPDGYVARFDPALEVLDATGAVIAREGDLLVGTCVPISHVGALPDPLWIGPRDIRSAS
ncbi:MAG TPA: hypothetical protein VJ850_00215 [Candidatus Limnocylindrales bacterium]|nr:hypothetical protein [Candidatus Limnocylindrales bacterium]